MKFHSSSTDPVVSELEVKIIIRGLPLSTSAFFASISLSKSRLGETPGAGGNICDSVLSLDLYRLYTCIVGWLSTRQTLVMIGQYDSR